MLYMIIERFHNGDPGPVYARFRERGRMAPEGLNYIGSWITTDLATCYQVMECDDEALLREWMSHWDDLTDFETIPVLTSAQASEAAQKR